MKRGMRTLALVFLGLVFTFGTATAQNLLPKKVWNLTIAVNVAGAQIWVDNALIAGNVAKVAAGDHAVKVRAPGYAEFNGSVKVLEHMTFTVRLQPLQPQGFPLTIRVPAPNARVWVDGAETTGAIPTVAPGNHTIKVSAPGYLDYLTTITVNAAMALDIPIQPGWTLTVSVNVPNAAITVDNAPIAGNAAAVSAGTHTLAVHADGYVDFVGSVNVNGNMTYAVRLVPAGVPLTIRVGVPNASVFVDGVEVTGTVPQVSKGPHAIRVTAPGYQEYNATVTVNAAMALDVALQPAGFALTIRVNVPGASVFVDGANVTGIAPLVSRGQHAIRVTAPGYQEYNASVAVSAAMALDVVLQPAGFALTVNANVAGATVTVNNVVKGSAPYTESLPPGTYAVRVSADGYSDYLATVSLNKPTTVSAVLRTTASFLTFVIPATSRDAELRGNEPGAAVRIYIDNQLVNRNRELEQIPVRPGRHLLRVASGPLSIQMPDFQVDPGVSYTIELSLTLQVTRTMVIGQ
jgi:hypothetical protein